ncbi:MAG: helicase-related protein [Pseudomonadota bacterium]
MKKAIYLPTGQNTLVVSEFDGYCEIFLDGEYKTVPKSDIGDVAASIASVSLPSLEEHIFADYLRKPISDLLYSFNTNRLSPEPHQYKPLIKFLNSENNRILIADEVGLGKTIEAGMIFKEIDQREDLKISLIVVPSSLTYKWKEELEIRFDEHFRILKSNEFIQLIDEFDGFHEGRSFNEKIIISYHTLRDERVIKKLRNSFFEVDFLIMDEAHTMRNAGTSTFESGEIITALADHIIFLSATPVQNSLSDIFNILSLLDNDYFKDYDYFTKMIAPNAVIHKTIAMLRNHNSLEEINGFLYEKGSFEGELGQVVGSLMKLNSIDSEQRIHFINCLIQCDHLSFIINRSKKKDVGRSIPRNATSVIVNITDAEQAYYDSVIEFVKFLNPSTPQGFITIMPERMASSSMIASLESFISMRKSGKLFIKDIEDLEDYYDDIDIRAEAMNYLDAVIERGSAIGINDSKFLRFDEIVRDLHSQNLRQMIVFSFFKKTLNYLEIKLTALGYKVGKIHGDFTIEERFAKIKEFKKGSFDILLSSEVGSEGLDMQFCNVVINYDLPWNPMRVEQRIGRIDRIGQKFDKLHIFNLCIEGSIEDRIYNRLYTKLDIFESSIGELEPILGDLQSRLNIAELIHLTPEEVEQRVHLQELAITREKIEIEGQTAEVEKLINDDYRFESEKEQWIGAEKTAYLQKQVRRLFLAFLEYKGIGFNELKDGTVKLTTDNTKRLIGILKERMSDKRTQSTRYRDEFNALRILNRQKELRITFESNNNDDYNTLYLSLSHPFIMMISPNKSATPLYTTIAHPNSSSAVGVIYRADIHARKPKSSLCITLLHGSGMVETLDYFDFITHATQVNEISTGDADSIKIRTMPHIMSYIEKLKSEESETLYRLIDVKIQALTNYYDKKIAQAKKMESKVKEEGVLRMREAQIDNLIEDKYSKITALEKQRDIAGSFEILGIVGIGE